jgi:hypothetical protein
MGENQWYRIETTEKGKTILVEDIDSMLGGPAHTFHLSFIILSIGVLVTNLSARRI